MIVSGEGAQPYIYMYPFSPKSPSHPGWHIFYFLYKVTMKVKVKVMSDSLPPRRLYSPWNSVGQNTGVGSLSLLQGIFPTQESNPGLPHCRRVLHHEPPGKPGLSGGLGAAAPSWPAAARQRPWGRRRAWSTEPARGSVGVA